MFISKFDRIRKFLKGLIEIITAVIFTILNTWALFNLFMPDNPDIAIMIYPMLAFIVALSETFFLKHVIASIQMYINYKTRCFIFNYKHRKSRKTYVTFKDCWKSTK